MNAKQQRFAEEYLVDFNATQAAIRAGYSSKTAGQKGFSLLKIVEIQEWITAERDKLSDRTSLTVQNIMERLDEIARRCMQAEAVLDKDGDPVHIDGEDGKLAELYEFQAPAATRALELIGKHLGAFVERHEIGGAGGGPLVTEIRRIIVDPAKGDSDE